jgi:hypothetical protein
MKRIYLIATLLIAAYGNIMAQDAAEMARMLQDPLANIKALMTDNDVNFNTGNNQTSYGFQLQPVYAVSFDKAGFNLINRAVIPIMGMAPNSQRAITGSDTLPSDPSGDLSWGLSDIALQFFFSPKTEGAWKWGVGPMVSLKTRTNDNFAGPGWGGGPVFVLVGGLGNFSIAAIAGHVWGENNFNLTILQPMLFYNIGDRGWALNYNNIISQDWSANSANSWTVPVGLGISKAIPLGQIGIEPSIGYYYNVVRPEGAADHIIKWAISFLF